MSANSRLLKLLAAASALAAAAPASPQAANQVRIDIVGTIPAQCDSRPYRVLVDNGVVLVTQYLRCNRPGRYVIRLSADTNQQWQGSVAKHKGQAKALDLGYAEFPVPAGAGADETFKIGRAPCRDGV